MHATRISNGYVAHRSSPRPGRMRWGARIMAFVAMALATASAACNTGPSAENLLTFVFFHVDPSAPGTTGAASIYSNIHVTRNNNNCIYIIAWDHSDGSSNTRTQLQLHFTPTSRLRIQRDDGKHYFQNIDGARGILTQIDLTRNQVFYQNLNATYDDALISSFEDNLADRAVATFQTFIQNYCATAT